MKTKIVFLLSTIFVFLFTTTVWAVPRPTIFGINDRNQECAEFFMGDEFSNCHLPDDWQAISNSRCPLGYHVVEMDSVCGSPNEVAQQSDPEKFVWIRPSLLFAILPALIAAVVIAVFVGWRQKRKNNNLL